MDNIKSISRRHFINITTTSSFGLIIQGRKILSSDIYITSDEIYSTEHFWYRKPSNSPYIDSQRGKKAFGFTNNSVFLSKDNSHKWPQSKIFPDALNITFSHIFENGNILFATRSKMYLSTDNLRSYKEIILKNPDGKDYIPHTPKNPDQPGWYFKSLSGVNSWLIGGKEMLVWGNYGNVVGGATPVNIYYSSDNGKTVKIAYSFGQNPYYRDDGVSRRYSISSSGTLLGNPDNPVICRHVHCVEYNPIENAFYATTGDDDRPEGYECHWLRGTYDSDKDSWNWKVILSKTLSSRYKSGGLTFVNGQLYFASDANGPEPNDRGIFRCNPSDIGNPKAHKMLFDPKYEVANMIIQDGVILAGHYATASPFTLGLIISPDMGKTWFEYDLKEFGARSPIQFNMKNEEGWFRVDLRSDWIDRADVLFIKPK